jgi:hypothetical protein
MPHICPTPSPRGLTLIGALLAITVIMKEIFYAVYCVRHKILVPEVLPTGKSDLISRGVLEEYFIFNMESILNY